MALCTVALLLGTTLMHLLALPVQLTPESPWSVAQPAEVYPGGARAGGALELIAVIISLAVLTAALSRPHLLFLCGGSALCLVGAFSVWVIFTEPVDEQAQRWLRGSLTGDLQGWRNQWEFSQLVRFLLHLAALLLLAASLFNLPAEGRRSHGVAHG